MNNFDKLFPGLPSCHGKWVSIYLEPIIGSGERISVAVAAIDSQNKYRVTQAIRSELLDCLYGKQAKNIQNFIDWIIQSYSSSIEKSNSLADWIPPFSGVSVSDIRAAADNNINGILRQAISFSASLSTLALEAEREEENDTAPHKNNETWVASISDLFQSYNLDARRFFNQKLQVTSTSEISTTYGFLTDKYVSNFGVLSPLRPGQSINTVKTKLYDLIALQKSDLVFFDKPESYEIILNTPNLLDPSISARNQDKLSETIDHLTTLCKSDGVNLMQMNNPEDAARYLAGKAA